MKPMLPGIFLLLLSFTVNGQGGTCNNAIPIPFDGTVHNYATSSSTGMEVVCTPSSESPVTWFAITTSPAGQCPLISITDPNGTPVEVAVITSCSGQLDRALDDRSSLCMYDGSGLWAPTHAITFLPNTTYYLRIKTASATNLEIAAQYFTPTNDDCFGASPISSTPIFDNNSCDKSGPNVLPNQLCALTLENTAFYTFVVQSTGASIVTIDQIFCDHYMALNEQGFQIGFFKGACNALEFINCFDGVGNNAIVQASTPSLTAGTRVYLAVDGNGGSNCKYRIAVSNGLLLPIAFKHFSAWKKNNKALIKWAASRELNEGRFYIQRSYDGKSFTDIGNITGKAPGNEEKTYDFEDLLGPENQFYRIRYRDENGNIEYSKTEIVTGDKDVKPEPRIVAINNRTISIQLYEKNIASKTFEVIDASGRRCTKQRAMTSAGWNNFQLTIPQLPAGIYYLRIHQNPELSTYPFFKQ